jgi:Arc-like DNA binding domain
MARKATDYAVFSLRFREALRGRLEREAQKHNVSLNAEIISRLEWSLRRDAEEDHTAQMVAKILAGLPAIVEMEADLAAMRRQLDLPPRQTAYGGILGQLTNPKPPSPVDLPRDIADLPPDTPVSSLTVDHLDQLRRKFEQERAGKLINKKDTAA